MPRVSGTRRCASNALPAMAPPTTKHVFAGPTACARAPPIAGPKMTPPLKPAITGAKVDARVSGVDMSLDVIWIAVINPATPTPVSARAAARPTVPSANAIAAKPPRLLC